MVYSSASQLAPLAIFIATFTLALVNLITSWLVWAEVKCTVNFALPINQFTPVQKSRHQVLKAYCPNIYTLSLLIRWEKRQYLFGEEVNPDHIFLALLIGIRLLNITFRIRLKLISIQPQVRRFLGPEIFFVYREAALHEVGKICIKSTQNSRKIHVQSCAY